MQAWRWIVIAVLVVACSGPPPTTTTGSPTETSAREAAREAATQLARAGIEGHLRLGEPTITGPIPASAVEAVFAARRGELQFCYDRALGRHDESIPPNGHLVLVFTVSQEGVTQRPIAIEDDSIDSASLTSCFVQTVGAWTYAAATGAPSHVRFPIDLSHDAPPPG